MNIFQHTSFKSKATLLHNHNTIITAKKTNNFIMSLKSLPICKFPQTSRNVFYLLKSFFSSVEKKIKTNWHAVGGNLELGIVPIVILCFRNTLLESDST